MRMVLPSLWVLKAVPSATVRRRFDEPPSPGEPLTASLPTRCWRVVVALLFIWAQTTNLGTDSLKKAITVIYNRVAHELLDLHVVNVVQMRARMWVRGNLGY